MKCTSCVSAARPKSDDEETASVSPAPTMDKEEYRVESPPPLPERSSRTPSVSIVELPQDFQRSSPAPSGSSQLLRPLDVITEETSDVSDSENRPPPPDLCFPRPKPRYKKPKSKNLLKSLLRQEPTTCVLVDAKIAEAAPEEYRSVCTTETVPEEILEVEVIDLGSNSSSLADLTDIDDLDPDRVNNNEEPPPIDSPKHPDDNDNDNESIVGGASLSEEDNNGYNEESSTQTPHDDACTQSADDDDDDGDHHGENDRTESDRDDEEAAISAERSLAADVDRVVTQCRNVNEVKDRDDRDEDDGSSDCCSEEQEVTHPAIGESLVTTRTTTEVCDSMGEEEAPPEVPPRPPPPPAAAMPKVVEPPTATVTNLGQDEVHEGRPHDAQVPAGGDTGEADPADADQSGEEDSGDAVVVPSDSSVLLKLLQDPVEAVEKRPTSVPDQISRAENCVGAAPSSAGTKIERVVKSEQLNYEIVQDHRVLREATVTNSSSSASSEVILRRRPSADRNESPKEPSPEQKAALVHDLRNEISRIKDAELQEEFRKLELEAARIERDLNNMAVVPPPAENLTYYVSKQNDFAVERPPPAALPRQKPPAPTPPTPPPKPTQIPSSNSSNDLMYNEWQAKMEERETRRLHKVVKLSKPEPSPAEPSEDPALGDEFLRKVKDRRRKFTIPGDSDPDTDTGSAPGTPIAGRKPVPKHIEKEFAEFAKIRKEQQQEAEEKPVSNFQQQSRPRPSNPPKAPPPQKISYPPPPVVTVASHATPIQNGGTDSVAIENGESVKVSALVDVFQQKQREVLRQDSYKAAVKSVASSAENLAAEEPVEQPVSVSAKCQEFERKLQRSASSDGRSSKPLTAVKQPSNGGGSVANRSSSTNRIGVWSPHNRSTEILTKSELAERSRDHQQQQQQQPPVWTPRSAPPSPASERREFRPIGFESPTPQRRNQPSSATPPPWTTSSGYEKPIEFSSKPNSSPATTRPEPTPLQNSNSLPSIGGGHSVRFANQQQQQQQQQISRQQAVPSPTINSLLKSKGNFPYKSSGGYQSEPEPNYDSDYTIKYSTLDRRRTPTALNPNSYSRFNTLQGSAVKSGATQYRNQPGRIENYIPGKSSISEKESKEWWDEVMDIFNGQIEQQKLSNSKTYTEGNLSRALKQEHQGGYDSDTTLIFRKKEPPASAALSPIEQKQYYKNMQAGGEIPVQGFRKPAPEKPKEFSNVPPPPPMKGTSLLPNSSSPYSKSSNEPESPRRYIESDVNIHYKTPIRYEYKEAIPDDELAYQQAEHMRRVYQEERRRKYMHELEDLQNRRHTDNFVPSQKSPIPVNRYEDFDADLAPKPVNVLPRTIARALYNFQGQTARELSFKKGDIIYLRRQIDKNWYEGEHNAMIGLLPANYIEILPRDGAKPLPKKPTREGKARAKFNFTAQTSVELSLMKGELVTLTRRVDDNWFEGRIGNKKGIFPVSYVEVLTDIGGEESYEIEPIVKPNLQAIQTHTLTTGYDNGLSNGRISPGIIRETKTVQKTEVLHVDTTNEPISYRALYNYKPQNSDELELHEGDVVYVLEKCDDGWYVGTSARTGCFGTFPGNYVKKL